VLKINNLSIGYNRNNNKKIIVSEINIGLNNNQLIALIGKNGSGKSTFIKTLIGINNKISGEIILFDKNINEYSQKELSKKIAYVSSRIIEQNNLNVYDLISLGRIPYTNWFGYLKEADKVKIDEIITKLKIEKFKYKEFNTLSDGEKQKVLIARALAQDTKIIILDEPSSHLDLAGKYELTSLLKSIVEEEKKLIIFSSHDINTAFYNADKIWMIHSKKLISDIPKNYKNIKEFRELFKNSSFDKIETERIIETIIPK
jgi:iron complex transport system ATP-binding protein